MNDKPFADSDSVARPSAPRSPAPLIVAATAFAVLLAAGGGLLSWDFRKSPDPSMADAPERVREAQKQQQSQQTPLDNDAVVRAAPPQQSEAETEAAPAIERYEVELRIDRGDTVPTLLRDAGVAPGEAAKVDAALKKLVKNLRLPVGESAQLLLMAPADPEAPPVLLSMSIRPRPELEWTVEREEEDGFVARERKYTVAPRLVRASGAMRGSFWASADAAGMSNAMIQEVTRAFSYDVDFTREVKAGDEFDVLIEQAVTSDGRVVHAGRVLFAELRTQKRTYAIYRFKADGQAEQFYSRNGESVVRSFLRMPIGVPRVSSRFGMRDHPVLGYTRLHTGVDFAAPTGTPVLAASAGKVAQAGWNGGYGLWVKLDHSAQWQTGYAHLSRIAPGIRAGSSVRQGQVIGFVGSTGMSTGPHLHYELHARGKPVNPLAHQRAAIRTPFSVKDQSRFKDLVARFERDRRAAPVIASLRGE